MTVEFATSANSDISDRAVVLADQTPPERPRFLLNVPRELWLVWITQLLLCGCGQQRIEFSEVKRIDEPITETEILFFLSIVDTLPEKTSPTFPPLYSPVPSWSLQRTPPVNELVEQEQADLHKKWFDARDTTAFRKDRKLERKLKRAGMTVEQFVALSLVIGTSLSRSAMEAGYDFPPLIEEGTKAVTKLKEEKRSFATLNEQTKFRLIRQATWVARLDRAQHLARIHANNRSLVLKYHEKLLAVFPADFAMNPLAQIADRRELQGIPFDELPDDGAFTDRFGWDPQDAVLSSNRAELP
ncbi:MAG: hypothetical protein ABGZ17_25715 [Planctomycetaceae bacterium]